MPARKKNIFGFGEQKVTYHRSARSRTTGSQSQADREERARQKEEADRKKRDEKEMRDWQIQILEEMAYEAGQRDKHAGKKAHPSGALVTVAGKKILGVTRASSLAHRSYLAGYRQNPAKRNPGASQSSTEFTLGYNLGQRDRESASLRKTIPELHATFGANFAAAPDANWEWFEEGYSSGYSGSMGAAAPNPISPSQWIAAKERRLISLGKQLKHASPAQRAKIHGEMGRLTDQVSREKAELRRKGNPEDDGAEEYEQARKIAELFHGRPVKEEIVIDELVRQHDWYWRIGPMVSLKVKTLTGQKITIPFSQTEQGMVHLFCSPDGRQFYLRAGDQELDLDAIDMGPGSEWFRDHMIIGVATEITYQDKKKFHKFRLTDYFHKLGEVTRQKPQLLYDAFAKKLQIVGGQYRVETEDLVESMSPGIVN